MTPPSSVVIPLPTPRFSLRLLLFLRRTGLTHAQAARHFGVSGSTFHKWLYGDRVPGAAVVRLLELLELIFNDHLWLHMRLINQTPCGPVKRGLVDKDRSVDLTRKGNSDSVQLSLDL